jgi:hypothetical protein
MGQAEGDPFDGLEPEDPMASYAPGAFDLDSDTADYDDEAVRFEVDEDVDLSSSTLLSLMSADVPPPSVPSASGSTRPASVEIDWDF